MNSRLCLPQIRAENTFQPRCYLWKLIRIPWIIANLCLLRSGAFLSLILIWRDLSSCSSCIRQPTTRSSSSILASENPLLRRRGSDLSLKLKSDTRGRRTAGQYRRAFLPHLSGAVHIAASRPQSPEYNCNHGKQSGIIAACPIPSFRRRNRETERSKINRRSIRFERDSIRQHGSWITAHIVMRSRGSRQATATPPGN